MASVSCIYNLGDPASYQEMLLSLKHGQSLEREGLIEALIKMQYERNDYEFSRGRIRIRGDVVEIFPSYSQKGIRVSLTEDNISGLCEFDPVSGRKTAQLQHTAIYPAKHFMASKAAISAATISIKEELKEQLEFLKGKNKLLEAQRLQSRTNYDLEMLNEIGYCHGIENYSRHLSGKPKGARPYSLIDYFHKDDFLVIIDESHATIPQVRGMYEGDRARKETLVEYGFRLPSCLDNRPLKFAEFNALIKKMVFVSATPDEYEIKHSAGNITEQIIRPTGLIDPKIILRPTDNQVEDLSNEIKKRAKKGERVLATTLTKRMAEDLSA